MTANSTAFDDQFTTAPGETAPSDTEMLDWLISSRMRIIYVHQADATRYVCRNWSFSELNDHTALHKAYDTPRKAIEAAMIDTGSKAFLSGLGRA